MLPLPATGGRMLESSRAEPRRSLGALLNQAEVLKERWQVLHVAATLGLRAETEDLRASAASNQRKAAALARELNGTRQREEQLSRALDSLQEQLRAARADAERALRRAVHEGQQALSYGLGRVGCWFASSDLQVCGYGRGGVHLPL